MPDEPVEDGDTSLERQADLALPEQVTAPAEPIPVEPEDTGYTPGGVPTFDLVREKIETRFGTAIGATELDAATPEGRSVDEQYEARQRAAAERLAQIRESMRSGDGAGTS